MRLKIEDSSRHPDLLRKTSEWNKPVGVKGVFSRISQLGNPLEGLVEDAFSEVGVMADTADVRYLTSGRFAHIFLLTAQDTSLIMQASRGRSTSEAGFVVEKDFKNLRGLQSIGGGYTPRAIAKGRIDVHGIEDVPISFTQFFDGYWEINYTDPSCGVCGFFTKNPEYGRLGKQTSIEIMRHIVKILSYFYAKTYDPATNEGRLVHGVCIDSGDFLYKKDQNKEGPLVRIITARDIDAASPREFLFYMLSPFEIHPIKNKRLRYVLNEFRLKTDRDPDGTILSGIREGIVEAYKSTYDIFNRWVDDAVANLNYDLDKVAAGLAEGRIQSFEEIPPGYRTFARLKAFLMQNVGINSPAIIPYHADYARAWESQRTNVAPHLRLAGERVLTCLSQAMGR